ncbi:MAG: DUF177 domain-containing protein [Caldimonas sp.]
MTAPRFADARRLDVAALAEAGGEMAGEWPQRGFARLATSTVAGAPDAPVHWQVVGERALLAGAGVQAALRIAATTEITLECQRCLQPLLLAQHVERRIFFVAGEDAAAALDAECDDDVLALTPALDLHALVEDELLLALPVVPRHEVCALPVPAATAATSAAGAPDRDDREHPFAALAALKRGPRPN